MSMAAQSLVSFPGSFNNFFILMLKSFLSSRDENYHLEWSIGIHQSYILVKFEGFVTLMNKRDA